MERLKTHTFWFGDWIIKSKEGCQQGDPLGPLCFSLVIQDIIVAISNACPNLALNLWYLDDIPLWTTLVKRVGASIFWLWLVQRHIYADYGCLRMIAKDDAVAYYLKIVYECKITEKN